MSAVWSTRSRRSLLAGLPLYVVFLFVCACAGEGPPRVRGPVFVPLDSWIYPALIRLAAMGYIAGQADALRPWTREECMRQLAAAESTQEERADRFRSGDLREAAHLISALREEFAHGHDSSDYVELESVYGRSLFAAGKPLIDGYNFGQTLINDYGRPLGEGPNGLVGLSADAVYGRISFYVRAESQFSSPFSSAADALRTSVPELEPVLPGSEAGVRRLRPVEMYAGIQLGGWALSVGKQDLWWGPGVSGPLSFSNNSEPFYSFRLTRTQPFMLPGPFRKVGGFRTEIVGGELSGHSLPPRPLLNGQRIIWTPTPDLEVGFTRWSLFGGAGVQGFTTKSLVRNLFANGATFGDAVDPGDRKSGFDFRWRLPAPGRPITIYSDFYADDEPSPLASPRRSAFSPGIYLARLPGFPHWDFRVEAPSTRLPATDQGGRFFYWNSVYHDANTNQGYLLGSWAGRDGRGLLVKTTYWRSTKSRFEFSYRQNRVGPAFLPGGGTQDDGAASGELRVRPQWMVRLNVQYERYSIPVLGPSRHDLAASLEVTYMPRWRLAHN